jgi:hypothetical protein
MQVEQQRFLVQPFSILTNNHAARASSSMVTATSAAGSSAADADEQAQEAAALRDGYSQHLRQQQLMRQRRRQLQLQQQQQAVYMQRSAAQAGFTPEEASRLAAQAYWGSGVATGLVRPTGGMYGAPAGLYGPDHGSQWPHRGPLASTAAADAGYDRQQQDALITAADGDAQSKRRQQGRLGRMASRIYALRPRLRKSDGTGERTLSAAGEGSGAGAAATVQQAGSAPVGMYKQLSASFKSGMAALTSSDAAAAADDAVTAGSGVAGADGTGAAGAAASGASYDGGVEAPADLSNTPAVLKSLGLPPDTVVVGPQYYIGGPQGPAARYSSLNPRCAHQSACCWHPWCCFCQRCLQLYQTAGGLDILSVHGQRDCTAPQHMHGLHGISHLHSMLPQHIRALHAVSASVYEVLGALLCSACCLHAGVSCSLLACTDLAVVGPAGTGASCMCPGHQHPSSCVAHPTWQIAPRWMEACRSLCWVAWTLWRLQDPPSTSAGSCRQSGTQLQDVHRHAYHTKKATCVE